MHTICTHLRARGVLDHHPQLAEVFQGLPRDGCSSCKKVLGQTRELNFGVLVLEVTHATPPFLVEHWAFGLGHMRHAKKEHKNIS